MKYNKDIEQYQLKYKALLEELKRIKPTPRVKKNNATGKVVK